MLSAHKDVGRVIGSLFNQSDFRVFMEVKSLGFLKCGEIISSVYGLIFLLVTSLLAVPFQRYPALHFEALFGQ